MKFLNKILGIETFDQQSVKLERFNNIEKEVNEINKTQVDNINIPRIIILPFYPYGHENIVDRQGQNIYYSNYEKGLSFYNDENYLSALEIFSSLISSEYVHSGLEIYLLRTYRKIIDQKFKENAFFLTFEYYNLMFGQTKDYTKTDVNKYYKLINLIRIKHPNYTIDESSFTKKFIENSEDNLINEFDINGIFQTEFFLVSKKGFKSPNKYYSLQEIKKTNNFLPSEIPYLSDVDNFHLLTEFEWYNTNLEINNSYYDLLLNKYLVISRDFKLHLISFNSNIEKTLDLSEYGDHLNSFRCLYFSKFGNFLFTYQDRVYIINHEFKLISKFETPKKEGYFKLNSENTNLFNRESNYQKYLELLEINKRNPTNEEIRKSFRSLAMKYHPDRNPNDSLANDKMIQIICAYEFLMKEDFIDAFEEQDEKEFWYNTSYNYKINVDGKNFEFGYHIGFDPIDPIYSCSFVDNNKIYLGTENGRVFLSDLHGKITKIFKIPIDDESVYGLPIIESIIEIDDYLYIKTRWYLYLLKNDVFIKHFEIEDKQVKWCDFGFVIHDNKLIRIFDFSGEVIGSIKSIHSIDHLLNKNNYLIIDTSKNAIKIKIC